MPPLTKISGELSRGLNCTFHAPARDAGAQIDNRVVSRAVAYLITKSEKDIEGACERPRSIPRIGMSDHECIPARKKKNICTPNPPKKAHKRRNVKNNQDFSECQKEPQALLKLPVFAASILDL